MTPFSALPPATLWAPATVTPTAGRGAGVTMAPVEAPSDPSAAPPCSYFEVGPTEGISTPLPPDTTDKPSLCKCYESKCFLCLQPVGGCRCLLLVMLA